MPYAKRIVLNCPRGYRVELDALVERFIQDRVAFVAVVGEDCAEVESIIDGLIVGEGSDTGRYILTSSHPGKSVGDAIAFANSLTGDMCVDEVQVVEL